MENLSVLLLKCPHTGNKEEDEVVQILETEGFKILERAEIKDYLSLIPIIYSDGRGNPLKFVQRDIQSRIKLYGNSQKASAFLLTHLIQNTFQSIDNLVGPTSFEKYKKPEFCNTLRARFLGPMVQETKENGEPIQIRIDAFHCCRTPQEFLREAKIYFSQEILEKYNIL
ncbi:MAG: hypothetical protein ABIH72_04720 [archaeon]